MNTKAAVSAVMVLLTLGWSASRALAHSGESHGKQANAPVSEDEHAFGKAGSAKQATRTIVVDMSDSMRFTPGHITARKGETIRFVVRNNGKMMHEMVIGTLDELKAHGELMKKHPTMEHDEAYMSHVGPGRQENLVWQFTRVGEFYYACLVAGHVEAGMIGKISVVEK